jgi:hypothetical protein
MTACTAKVLVCGFVTTSLLAGPARGQTPTTSDQQSPAATQTPRATSVTCASKVGERQECPANTSRGVVLARSYGASACLLGKTWGYDDKGVWVADGCVADFIVATGATVVPTPEAQKGAPRYVPNGGFLIVEHEKGEVYVRLFSYARYLNQKGLDETYTDAFGKVHTVTRREDAQLNKFFLPFSGWFLTPKFRYYLYVWSANTAQGIPRRWWAAGTSATCSTRYVTLARGSPACRAFAAPRASSRTGSVVDDRLIADEFFRGSYTTGFWLRASSPRSSIPGDDRQQPEHAWRQRSATRQHVRHHVVHAAVAADDGEFGLFGTFGDFDYHEKLATRLAVHYTHSTEDKQSQPGSDSIENTQIRLTDGSSIFTPDLFGQGITVERVNYQMSSVDGGLKYKGLSLEAEWYWRWLSDYTGINTASIPDIDDHGYRSRARRWWSRTCSRPTWATRASTVSTATIGGAGRRQHLSGQTARLPGEHRVDPRESLAGRIHGLSAAGRRQRRRAPPEPRTEFLRLTSRFDATSGRNMRIPHRLTIALALALATAGLGADQTPAGGAGAGDDFNDSHFHLTNYVQKGIDVRAFLQIMGTRVHRSTLFGIPLQQQWSYANSGEFAPTYYLQSDAPLYYYSFTDAFIARRIARSARGAGAIRSDDHRLRSGRHVRVDHIRRVLTTFPGVFTGIGEFSIHKEFVSAKISGETASLTNPRSIGSSTSPAKWDSW